MEVSGDGVVSLGEFLEWYFGGDHADDSILIDGDFLDTPDLACRFDGDTRVAATFLSATSISCPLPDGARTVAVAHHCDDFSDAVAFGDAATPDPTAAPGPTAAPAPTAAPEPTPAPAPEPTPAPAPTPVAAAAPAPTLSLIHI